MAALTIAKFKTDAFDPEAKRVQTRFDGTDDKLDAILAKLGAGAPPVGDPPAPPPVPVLPVVSIVATGPAQAEGQTNFVFVLTRTGDISKPCSGYARIMGIGPNPATAADFVGGALPNDDWDFKAGQAQTTYVVPVAADTAAEQDEGFQVSLYDPDGCTLGVYVATAKILNDDAVAPPPVVVPPTPVPPTPTSGLLLSDDFTVLSLYNRLENPTGRYRTNAYWGGDGEIHTGQYAGLWKDAASSRQFSPANQPFMFTDNYYMPGVGNVHRLIPGGGLLLDLIKNPDIKDPRTIDASNGRTSKVLGAMISPQQIGRPVYGRFEAVMTLSSILGAFSQFWLWDESAEEIDGMEQTSNIPGRLWQHTHAPDALAAKVEGVDVSKPHTHTIDWRQDRIKWLLDGAVIQDIPNPGMHRPKVLFVNNAGGGWDGNDQFPANFASAPIKLHSLKIWK